MMPAPMFGRVAAVLAPLVTVFVTFLVAPPLIISPALGQNTPLPTQVVPRELRIGAPGVPSALDPGAALEGTSPLIARQLFDTPVPSREGSTEIEPALATRWNASRDGLDWAFTLREGVKFHDVSADDQAESGLDSRSLDIWFPAAPPRRAEGALSAPGLRIGYLAFQTEKEPFSRRTLRQAVAAAVDPAILGQALDRAAVPLQSFLPPGVWGRREGSPILGGSRTTVKAL